MKTCIECSSKKPLDEFYAHPQMADGTVNVCKVCHKMRMKRRRLTNPYVQEYDRLRYQQPERKIATRKISELWKSKNQIAYRAHYTVTNAVRDGRLKKEPCVFCGETKRVHGHHRDYSRPLDVIWLCAKCHQRLHASFPELGANFDGAAK